MVGSNSILLCSYCNGVNNLLKSIKSTAIEYSEENDRLSGEKQNNNEGFHVMS